MKVSGFLREDPSKFMTIDVISSLREEYCLAKEAEERVDVKIFSGYCDSVQTFQERRVPLFQCVILQLLLL